MSGVTVYLCGPMTHLTFEEADDWRERATQELAPHGFTVISPLREVAALFRDGVMDLHYEKFVNSPELLPKPTLARDLFDVRRSDIILANMAGIPHIDSTWWNDEMYVPSIGSDGEMMAGHLLGKVIVLAAPPDNPYRRHPFPLAWSDFICDSYLQGTHWIRENFKAHL